MDAHARVVAFERAGLRALASEVHLVQVDGTTVGEVVLTADAPRIRDHNAVVLGPAPTLDGPAVAALLDRELGGRGLPHRRLYCTTEDADRWRAALESRGYEGRDTVAMRWPGGPLPATGDATIEVADEALAGAATRALRGGELDEDEPAEVLDQMAWIVRRQHALGARVLVARDGRDPVGHVRVFLGSDVAQVEELDVHPAAQGRGIGRALLAAALEVAGDRELVFLTADPDDWPAAWYERLGFLRVGRSSGFLRTTPDDPA